MMLRLPLLPISNRLLLAALAAMLAACQTGEAGGPQAGACDGDTVVWISVDGMHADDVAAAETPFLDRIAATGGYSGALIPPFPSLTFAAHATKATGADVAVHGIPGNVFFDRRDGAVHAYPQPQALLEAEPIWTTATRQGVRTLVFDWPLSHAQQGPHAAALHREAFSRGARDTARTDRLLEAWRADEARGGGTRLVMAWLSGPDGPGHRHGPGHAAVRAAVERSDRLLLRIWEAAVEIVEARACDPPVSLHFMVSSDHGMAPVAHAVHPLRLAFGRPHAEGVEVVTTGPLAQFFFAAPDEAQLEAVEARVARHDFARAYRAQTLPEGWRIAHPHRTGDLVVVLAPGHVFSRRAGELRVPSSRVGLRGAHGHDPAEVPEMRTVLYRQRHPEALGGQDLGRLPMQHLHAAVAELLGIAPAATAE